MRNTPCNPASLPRRRSGGRLLAVPADTDHAGRITDAGVVGGVQRVLGIGCGVVHNLRAPRHPPRRHVTHRIVLECMQTLFVVAIARGAL